MRQNTTLLSFNSQEYRLTSQYFKI